MENRKHGHFWNIHWRLDFVSYLLLQRAVKYQEYLFCKPIKYTTHFSPAHSCCTGHPVIPYCFIYEAENRKQKEFPISYHSHDPSVLCIQNCRLTILCPYNKVIAAQYLGMLMEPGLFKFKVSGFCCCLSNMQLSSKDMFC